MSKNQRGKTQIPSHFNQNSYSYQPNQQQFPTQSSYQNQTSNSNIPQQNQNVFQSQQNSNHYQNSQNSGYAQNPSFQQNYSDEYYSSPNSQRRSTMPNTYPNLSRNLNNSFEENSFGNEFTRIDVNEIPDSFTEIPQSKAQKMVKWSHEEQAELSYCWVECSRDNKKGTSQSDSSFWHSVCKLFNSRSPHNQPRSVDSLKQQWKRINASCQRWKEIMAGLDSRQQSGATDTDLVMSFTVRLCY